MPGVQTCALPDRKSTRLNSSHTIISYAVFCLKKKDPLDPRAWRHALARNHAVSVQHARRALQGDAGNQLRLFLFFFFNDPAPAEIYPLSLPAALPIGRGLPPPLHGAVSADGRLLLAAADADGNRSEEHTSELQSHDKIGCRLFLA